MKHTCMLKASGEPGETRQDYSGEYGVKMVNICVFSRASHSTSRVGVPLGLTVLPSKALTLTTLS